MSGVGPYSLPAGAAGGVSAKDRATQLDKLFGKDIWFDVTQGGEADYEVTDAGDWKLAEGRVALRQAIIRRIITDPGEWQTLPNYGVGARMFVKAKNTRAARDELSERIRGQLLQDPRIEKVDAVNVEINPDSVRIAVTVTPKGQSIRNSPVRAAVEVS